MFCIKKKILAIEEKRKYEVAVESVRFIMQFFRVIYICLTCVGLLA